jgi:hypothetical protein
MAEQMRPASPKDAPDPSNNYERSHPEREAGMGRLDNNKSVPTNRPDHMDDAVRNKQDPSRQVNAQEVTGHAAGARLAPQQPDHSMHEEEPDGWDQAPSDINDPSQKRHPRTGGKGGTPDAGETRRKG